jgi:GNAT superfamily N-acetyltransferase
MAFKLFEVNSKNLRDEFLNLPIRLYNKESNWIRPLNTDIETVFDPKRNKRFRNGEAIRWIIKDQNEVVVGRIAAFIDYQTSKTNTQPTGGVGFFECINDFDAAAALFNAGKSWLESRGMEAMDGPINFGDRDRWWGLLIDGDYEPNYCMDYHHSYYNQLFEQYGFKPYFHQYTYHMQVTDKNVDPIMWEKADRIFRNPEYTIKNISKNNLPKFASDFVTIYNKAWGRYTGVNKMSNAQANILLNTIKPILDERLMLFAYHLGEPIGFLIMVPDLNQAVKYLNGNFNIFGKIKLMYLLKVKKVCRKALGLIFGIIPQHQGKGVEGALVREFAKHALKNDYPYNEIELNWIGDFNPTMRKIAEQIGAKVRKTHITFRYMFDQTKEVVPPRRVS